MLTSISADIPATPKLCGFMSHSARQGYSKCLKEFGCLEFDYSGFDTSTWSSRNHDSHMHILTKIMQSKSSLEKKRITTNMGS